jgi:acyl dehydratase
MSEERSDLAIGATMASVVAENLSRTQIVMYAGASGDYNPLHTDEIFATKRAGYPSVFAHGMLTMGMTARVLTNWVGEGQLTSYSARFARQVWPGDTLAAVATVVRLRLDHDQPLIDFDIVTRNQDGDEVMTGKASARIPDDLT